MSLRDGRITGTFETKPLDYEGAVNAMLGRSIDVDAVADAELQEPTAPLACPVGSPGVESYLYQLQHVAFYPLT